MPCHRCSPVLLIIFNRPDLTQRVFARIREARPVKLFVAADGPRPDHPGEEGLCAAARRIADQVDWPCELKTLFHEQNLGCKHGPSSAITWFFEHVDEGIILEDDCLPDPSFFPFCTELLERFRNDCRVFMVSGTNDLGTWKETQHSYFFTFGNTWGWATWKRAWRHFDLELKLWTDESAQHNMRAFGQRAPYSAAAVANGCRAVLSENLDAWDYQWAFIRIAHNGLGVIPAMNLVSNIGFVKDATHTTSHASPYADMPVYEMQFPLRHNTDMRIDFEYFEQYHKAKSVPSLRPAKNRLKSYYQRLRPLMYRK